LNKCEQEVLLYQWKTLKALFIFSESKNEARKDEKNDKPPAKAKMSPKTLAKSVRKDKYCGISIPLKITFISGIPEPKQMQQLSS
jgi:hypothetical protein